MREIFVHSRPTPEQDRIYSWAQARLDREGPMTPRQLYYALDKDGQAGKMVEKHFTKFIRKGLWCGAVDWEKLICPLARHLSFKEGVTGPLNELVVRAPEMGPWFASNYQDMGFTGLLWSGRSWSAHQIRETAVRWAPHLEHGIDAWYVTNSYRTTATTLNWLRHRLTLVMVVNLARSAVNARLGRDVWRPDGVAVQTHDSLSKTARLIGKETAALKRLAKTNFRFHMIGLTQEMAKDSKVNRLEEFSPQELREFCQAHSCAPVAER